MLFFYRGALIKQPASLLEQAHVSKQVADELLAEVITDELGQLVRDTSMQHITRYIREDAYHSHINNLIDEETINAVSSMVSSQTWSFYVKCILLIFIILKLVFPSSVVISTRDCNILYKKFCFQAAYFIVILIIV